VGDAGTLPADALIAALFTQSPLSVALYDVDGRVAAGNAAYERHFGLRVADVPADWSLFTDAQLAAAGVLPLIARAYAGEGVTLPAVRYDAAAATGGRGRAVWTEGHCYPVRDAAGRVTHVAVVHVDVTAWAEAEAARVAAVADVTGANARLVAQAAELEAQAAALQATAAHLAEQTEAAHRARDRAEAARRAAEAAESRLQSVFTTAPAVIAVTEGPEHRFTLLNATARRVGGGRDAVGRTYAEVYPEGAAQGFVALLDRVYATGEPYVAREARLALERPEGGTDELFLDFVYEPLRDVSPGGGPGPVVGVLHFAVDVTAQVRARTAVTRSEAQFRALAEAIPAILFLTAPDGRNLYTNPQFQAYAGLDADALLGDGWLRVVHPDDRAAAGAAWAAAVRDGAPYEVEYRFRRHDGAYRWFLGRGLPYRDPATGETACWVGVCADIDARKAAAAEAALARAAAEAAQHRAEAANQAKGQFLANMSHELRTPLNAIGGYAQLIELGLHGPVTDAQRAALGRVQSAQTRLLSLINDVLNYAKLESGRVEYDLRPVDVRDVVAEVVPLVEPQLRAKGLAFDVYVPEAPCVVWADPEKLGQVLVNLLSNAIKFTDAGDGRPGRVTVSVAMRGTDGGRAESAFVCVTDTGIGVPRDKQAAIFEPFVQVRSGYAQATEGTGLGLAISRDLVRGMGGDLRVRSQVGEGSAFTVSLRRVVDVAGQPTDRRVGDERRDDVRRTGDDRRASGAGHTSSALAIGIPPALDRALAGAVLTAAGTPTHADGNDGAMPPIVAEAVARVIAMLTAQGAAAETVSLALEDAFAALLAGQRDPLARGRVRTLAAGARQLALARAGTAAAAARPSGEQHEGQ
jgi:PAS domain S-box-containing protein